MAWFYYSGNVVKAIPVGKGRSVAARPHSKIEILDETPIEVQTLIGRGLLRPTGKPRDMRDGTPAPAPVEPAVLPVAGMSAEIAEKGRTTKADMPPRTVGQPEFTEGESRGRAASISDAVAEVLPEAPKLSGEHANKKRRRE